MLYEKLTMHHVTLGNLIKLSVINNSWVRENNPNTNKCQNFDLPSLHTQKLVGVMKSGLIRALMCLQYAPSISSYFSVDSRFVNQLRYSEFQICLSSTMMKLGT